MKVSTAKRSVAKKKAERRKEPAARIAAGPIAEKIRADLPFSFTGAQEDLFTNYIVNMPPS